MVAAQGQCGGTSVITDRHAKLFSDAVEHIHHRFAAAEQETGSAGHRQKARPGALKWNAMRREPWHNPCRLLCQKQTEMRVIAVARDSSKLGYEFRWHVLPGREPCRCVMNRTKVAGMAGIPAAQ